MDVVSICFTLLWNVIFFSNEQLALSFFSLPENDRRKKERKKNCCKKGQKNAPRDEFCSLFLFVSIEKQFVDGMFPFEQLTTTRTSFVSLQRLLNATGTEHMATERRGKLCGCSRFPKTNQTFDSGHILSSGFIRYHSRWFL